MQDVVRHYSHYSYSYCCVLALDQTVGRTVLLFVVLLVYLGLKKMNTYHYLVFWIVAER